MQDLADKIPTKTLSHEGQPLVTYVLILYKPLTKSSLGVIVFSYFSSLTTTKNSKRRKQMKKIAILGVVAVVVFFSFTAVFADDPHRMSGIFSQAEIVGNVLYISSYSTPDESGDFLKYDVSNPQSPVLLAREHQLGVFDDDFFSFEVVPENGRVFTLARHYDYDSCCESGCLAEVTPATMQEKQTFACRFGIGGGVVAPNADFIFTASSMYPKLESYSVSNPQPDLLTNGFYSLKKPARKVFLERKTEKTGQVFILENDGVLEVFQYDLRYPNHPFWGEGSWTLPSNFGELLEGLFINNNLYAIAEGNQSYLIRLPIPEDTSSLRYATLDKTLVLPVKAFQQTGKLREDGDYLYLAAGEAGWLKISRDLKVLETRKFREGFPEDVIPLGAGYFVFGRFFSQDIPEFDQPGMSPAIQLLLLN